MILILVPELEPSMSFSLETLIPFNTNANGKKAGGSMFRKNKEMLLTYLTLQYQTYVLIILISRRIVMTTIALIVSQTFPPTLTQ